MAWRIGPGLFVLLSERLRSDLLVDLSRLYRQDYYHGEAVCVIEVVLVHTTR